MDVSDLWDGCLYRTDIEKDSACPDFVEGLFLYDWNFWRRTGKWKCAQVF